MQLNSVVFYQGVKLWDNNLYNTVVSGKNKQLTGITVELKDHLLFLRSENHGNVIVVGTANMRQAEYAMPSGKSEEVGEPAIIRPTKEVEVQFNSDPYRVEPETIMQIEKPHRAKKIK